MTSDLLQRYLSGDATESEKELVMEWINEHPNHLREYMALRKMHDTIMWQSEQTTIKERQNGIFFRIALRELMKIAAVIAIAILGIHLFFDTEKEERVSFQTIYVPLGQRTELTLFDGTRVWLNSGTRFTFPSCFGRDTRSVQLDGEGYFKVAKDSIHPFIVETEKYNVQVLGTEFNVKAYSTDSTWETSLIQGSVALYASKVPQQKTKLMPHTMACLQNGHLIKRPIQELNDFLWREGILNFDDNNIAEMIGKLQLYYGIKIEVHNKYLLSQHYTGKFRIKDGIEHILKVLQLNNHFTYTKDDEKNIITIY